MIEIRMETKRLKLSIKGHATPEESEQYKEICAAASALAQSLMYSISKYDDVQKAVKSIQYRPDPGDLFLLVIPESWADMVMKHRFKVYGDGLELLAKSHPYSVTMIRDGEKILPDEEGGQ